MSADNTVNFWTAKRKRKSAVKSLLAMNRKPWVCPNGTKPLRGAPGGHGPYSADVINEPISCPECGAMLHRRRVFLNQESDWLDPEVLIADLVEMLDTMRQCRDITHILCTKRPELFFERMEAVAKWDEDHTSGKDFHQWICQWAWPTPDEIPPRNVIMLTSGEDQKRADGRIPHLLRIPAVVRGLSCEPLLESINIGLDGIVPKDISRRYQPVGNMLQWVIAGGGKRARPCNIEWLRSLRDQCKAAGVPFFCKQDSGARDGQQGRIPDDIWNIKEFPSCLT